MESDKYIELLKWVRNSADGVSMEELKEKLKHLNFEYAYGGYQNTLNSFTIGTFIKNNGKMILTFEAYFQLLEHERLEQARIDSKRATLLATWSLWVSIGVGLAGLIVGILQLIKT